MIDTGAIPALSIISPLLSVRLSHKCNKLCCAVLCAIGFMVYVDGGIIGVCRYQTVEPEFLLPLIFANRLL